MPHASRERLLQKIFTYGLVSLLAGAVEKQDDEKSEACAATQVLPRSRGGA